MINVRIGELADRLGLNPKTIRYYEGIGLLPEPERSPSGYRDYGEQTAELLTFIRTAQRLGLKLDEVREILALRNRGEPPCGYVRALLHRQVGEIDQRIAELRQLRKDLVALDAVADGLLESDASRCRLIEHVQQRAARPATPADRS